MAKNNFNGYLFLFFITVILVINFPILIPIMIVIFLIFKKGREEQRQKFLKFFGIKSIEELNYFYKKGKNIKYDYYKKNKNNYSKNSNLNRNKIEKEIIEALVKNEKDSYKIDIGQRINKVYGENNVRNELDKTELYNNSYDEFLKLSNYQKNKILGIDTIKKDKNNNFTIIPEKNSKKTKTKFKYKSNYKVHHYNTKFKSIWDNYESVIDTMGKNKK